MWYKNQPDGTWIAANKVYIPSNPNAPIVLEFNHNVQRDGWAWSANPPQGYLDWLESERNAVVISSEPIVNTDKTIFARTINISAETTIKEEAAETVPNKRTISEPIKKSLSLYERVKRFFVKLFNL